MELRPYQKECIEALPERGAFLIQMATGLGKCFAPDTQILMFDGIVKKVQDIKFGDAVMGPDSRPRIVLSLAHGREQMYEIRQNKKDSYTVNESHILTLQITGLSSSRKKYVCDSLGNRYTTGDIVNISVRDYLACSNSFKHAAKGYSAAVDFPSMSGQDYFDPYFLGLWLGDGNSRNMAITTQDAEVAEYIHEFAKQHGYEVIERDFDKPNKAKLYALKNPKHDAYMRRFMREHLFLNKHIPFFYKVAPRDVRLKLLAGLLDSDGYLHAQDKSTFEFCSKDAALVSDIVFLARSLGLSARKFTRYNRLYSREYYYCSIWGPTQTIPTRVRHKQAQSNANKNNLLTGITVTPAGEGEYYGFELGGGVDRRFMLADFTVVHNTVTFANIPRRGRMLILSHRDELVRQPRKYFNCSFGIEQAGERSCYEEVISASVPSLVRRLHRFEPDMFDIIVVDEAHHAAAASYRKILDYFKPRLLLGFTATPNRGDGVGLDGIFEDIIFERDLEWGIRNGYLADIKCIRCDIGFDLRCVSSRLGDYSAEELDKAVNIESANQAVADAYRRYARGRTLIFAVSVAHAEAIAREIPGSEVVIGGKDRTSILERFQSGDLKCLVNCMVFTEGTDLPGVETVIIARPTQNVALYTQMVGRGTRLFPGKEYLTLIDCVGASALNLCTAPSLLGLDVSVLEPKDRKNLDEADIFNLPEVLARTMDTPRYWIKNAHIVNLWAKGRKYNLHGVNWFRTARGDLVLGKPRFRLPAPDKLGRVVWNGAKVSYQRALDDVYKSLCTNYEDMRNLWDAGRARKWGDYRATDKQKAMVRRFLPEYDVETLTKAEAAAVLTRMFLGRDLQ